MMNQSNSSNSSSSMKILCSNCKAKVSYPLTLHCNHKLCFKCSEKINKKDRELYSIVCPQCKAITQTTNIYQLHQDNINSSDLKENYMINIHNQQLPGNTIDQNVDNSNANKKQDIQQYYEEEMQLQQQGQLGQAIQNEMVDDEFQFQNIPEEDEGQGGNVFNNLQVMQNKGNLGINENISQQQEIFGDNLNQIQSDNQEYQQDEGQIHFNELQIDQQDLLDPNTWNQNQFVQNQQYQFVKPRGGEDDEQHPMQKYENQMIDEQGQQQYLQNYQKQQYYGDESLENLQDNLKKGIIPMASSGRENVRSIKKNSVHNLPSSNESLPNQLSIRIGMGNSQGSNGNNNGMIFNPHYYPQHAKNNANRFISNSEKNNFLKKEQDNVHTQQSSSDFQVFQSHPSQQQQQNNNNRFPSNPSKIQQEYGENIQHNYNQERYSPKVVQKLEFSPSGNHQNQINKFQNQQLRDNNNNLNHHERMMLPNEQQILMIEDLNANQLGEMGDQLPLDSNEYEEQKNYLPQQRGVNNGDESQFNFHSQNQQQQQQQQQQHQYNLQNHPMAAEDYLDHNYNYGEQKEMATGAQVIMTVGGGSINPAKPLICKEHNDYVQLYCQDDKSLLCVNCLYQNDKHNRHRVAPLKKRIDLIKKENQQFKLEAKEKLTLIENSLKICNSNKKVLNEGYSFLCESVSREFAEIQRVLVEQEKRIQMQIQAIFEERLKEYDQMLNDLSYLKNCIKDYRDCDKNSNPNLTVYVFSIYSMIRNTLKNIDFSFKQINKNDINICDFKNNRSTIISEIQSFGKIINDLNIRDPNTSSTPAPPHQNHLSQASSTQKQNALNSHSNSKSNFESNKKGISTNSYQQFHQGSSLTSSASKTNIHQQSVPVQQFQPGAPHQQSQQHQHTSQQNTGQRTLQQNQKSSVSSLDAQVNHQVNQLQPHKSQQNLLQDQMVIQGNHNIQFSPFNDQQQNVLNSQNRNPKSRNQTPSPYKYNQKQGQGVIKELNTNLQFHRDFLDVQFEQSKKQTPRQISYHNQNQPQSYQQQHQQHQLQQQSASVSTNNPQSSSYAKLIVSRSTKFSNKKQQQESVKELQKCQTPPQDRRMNDLVKNIQNISYYALLEEKYNKRSKSSQKKPTLNQNQVIQK